MSAITDSGKLQPLVSLDIEQAVRNRYSAASRDRQSALCCPIQYDQQLLAVLPPELIERDYGCGDPSRYVAAGETVVDLGSGGGKICYIASQIVGPEGKIIGVDMNDDMLALARKHQPAVASAIGWDNVRFCKGRIQDLSLDLERFEEWLVQNPIANSADWLAADRRADEMRRQAPMIASDSVDVVLSNCVLNLVKPADRGRLFAEVFRVLKRGGRAVISDIVCDEPVPERLQHDAELWSGCISGAFLEQELLAAFADAGFYGMQILERQTEPWAVVEGIEFRSMTVGAYKGKEGPCMDHRQAVIYRGPWKSVADDDGHVLHRGQRSAVCEKTFRIYSSPPYAGQVELIEPYEPVAPDDAPAFDCRRSAIRHPRETKGQSFDKTQAPQNDCCAPGECC